MELKWVSLRELSEKAGVDYWTASRLLNGKAIDRESLRKLKTALNEIPMPKRSHAA